MTTDMPQPPSAPLLSIVIPAYNGAKFLRVALQALLPQASTLRDTVEVLVVDDASTDDTPGVLEAAQRYGPVRYIRNPSNIGMARNIVKGPVEHAAGEFVWAWSQHCLIHPGALAQVVNILQEKRRFEGFYVNFRCAKFPEQWPQEALGGYDGQYDYLGNGDLSSHRVQRWEELLDAKTAVCTQSYVHILRRSSWTSYWANRSISANTGNARETYPQTCTVAESMFAKPSYYIGQPMLTIYNGAQTWGSTKYRARVLLQGFPDLLRLYQQLGWRGPKSLEARVLGARNARKVMTEVFRDWQPEEGRRILKYVCKYWYQKGVIRAFWMAFVDSECCWLSRCITKAGDRLTAAYQYFFINWRPARWIRTRFTRD